MARSNHSGRARSGFALAVLCAVWFTPSAGPAQARGNLTPALAAICNRLVRGEPIPRGLRLCVSVARHSSGDDALPGRHRRLKIKRLRRSFGGLPSSTALRNELLVAGIRGTIEVVNLDLQAPSSDHARAPPAANQRIARGQ